MFTIYNGIECTCGNCGALSCFNVRWANQHGTSIRLFCDECGYWTDRKITRNYGEEMRTFQPKIPHPTYVDRQFEMSEGREAGR